MNDLDSLVSTILVALLTVTLLLVLGHDALGAWNHLVAPLAAVAR